MKRHLFYTFLVIFVATTIVTLLGLIGLIHIPGGYLTGLVSAFLVELAGAVVAIFRRADFFTDEDQKHAEELKRTREQHQDEIKQLQRQQSQREQQEIASITASLQGKIDLLTRH